jgi:hypothetical protein
MYCKKPPTDDKTYRAYWNQGKVAGLTFSNSKGGSLQGKTPCPECGEMTGIRLCQTCHSELPYTFGSYQDETFSVIGLKESGKTHYIAMLINIFGSRIAEQFDVSMEIVHDDVSRKFKEVFGKNINQTDNRTTIEETRSGKDSSEIRRPLIYKLAFRKKGFLGSKKLDIATVSIFDNAGEDLKEEGKIRNYNKSVFNASGIILIIDPLQLPKIRAELSVRGVRLPSDAHGETKDIVSRVAKIIRDNNAIEQNKLIEIPIAVAISKSDALKDIIGEGNSMIFQESAHEKTLNKSEIEGINTEIESFLSSWDDTGLVTQIKNNFKNYCFFGFTALGSNPGKDMIIHKLRPLRVEDPFLWLLHKRNLIKMK